MSKLATLNDGYSSGEAAVKAATKPGLWTRIHNSIVLSRQRAAERDIGRFIELHGGQMTDEMEREISRRFGGPAGGR
jgi:hypothetical protein